MNYKNNMDRYYMQAHYNKVKNKEKRRNIILWLLSLIGLLLMGLFFLYQLFFKMDKVNVSDSATVATGSVERALETESSERDLKRKDTKQEKIVSVEREEAPKKEAPKKVEVESHLKDRVASNVEAVKKSNVKVENHVASTATTVDKKSQEALEKAKKALDAERNAMKNSGAEERISSKATTTSTEKVVEHSILKNLKDHKEAMANKASAIVENGKATLTNNTKVALENNKTSLTKVGTAVVEHARDISNSKTTSVEINESNKNTLLDKERVIALEKNSTSNKEVKGDIKTATTAVSKIDPNEPLFHIYIVSSGETISSIAMKEYNDGGMYQSIIDANPDLENPNNIREGDEILLPIVDEAKEYSDILHFK